VTPPEIRSRHCYEIVERKEVKFRAKQVGGRLRALTISRPFDPSSTHMRRALRQARGQLQASLNAYFFNRSATGIGCAMVASPRTHTRQPLYFCTDPNKYRSGPVEISTSPPNQLKSLTERKVAFSGGSQLNLQPCSSRSFEALLYRPCQAGLAVAQLKSEHALARE